MRLVNRIQFVSQLLDSFEAKKNYCFEGLVGLSQGSERVSLTSHDCLGPEGQHE